MGWFDDAFVDPLVGGISDLLSGDIGGALENWAEFGLNVVSGGFYTYAKGALNDYIQGLIPEQDYQDRQRTVRSATEPKTVIYGRVKTGGHLVYVEDDGKDNTVLWMCYVLAGHSCKRVVGVYANDVLIAESDGFDGAMSQIENEVTGNNHLCWAVHGKRYGAFIPGVVHNYDDDSYDYNGSPPNWTLDHRLTYQTYVWISLAFDKETFGDVGVPKFKFEVEGKDDIYDPRTGTSGYTDNQGLIMLDILRWDRMFDEPLADINLQDFEDAANLADDLVATGDGGTEKRYSINGTFKMQAAPLEILQSVARAGAAQPFYDVSTGQWRVVPGDYQAPVMDLDESDLIGGIQFQPGPGKNNRYNKISGTYVDAAQNFETVGFPELYVSDYVTQDGEVLEKDMDFPFSESGTMARRLAKIELERNRFGVSCQATFKFKAMQLTPGDRVNLYNQRLGWNPKIFRVEEIDAAFETGVNLKLREDAPEIYEWTEADALALDQPPVLSIPNGLTISPPDSLSFSEELYQTLTRAAVKVRVTVSWPDQPSAVAYDIQYKQQTETTWIDAATFWQDSSVEIPDVEDVPYDFRVRSINGIGRKSAWLEVPYTVIGKTAPPPDVPLLFIEKRVLKWTYPNAPLDIAGFLVRFQNGDRRFWADATAAHEGIVTETLFDVSEFSGTKTFLVRAIDTTGNLSENAAVLVQGLGDAPVENVIVTQEEAPDWSSSVQDYQFSVRTGGVTEDLDVKSGLSTEPFLVTSAASFTGAFVNANGYLEGVEIGDFYGESSAIFYNADETADFYGAEYQRIEYEYTFTVDPADEGSSLTVESIIQGAFNQRFDYLPPGFTGDPLAFPGAVVAEAGTYSFFLAIPQQQLPSPPIVENIITRLDVGDVEERLADVVIASGGTRLPIVRNYRAIVVVNLTLQDDGGTASTIKILDKDSTLGPLVQAYNDSGVAVSATIDALIQGY